jgi:hypothetical protein
VSFDGEDGHLCDETCVPTRYRRYSGAMVPDHDGQWLHVSDFDVKGWTLDPLVQALDVELLRDAIDSAMTDDEVPWSERPRPAQVAAEYARLASEERR